MTILNVYSAEVQDSWTDHYGHMNEGYYVVAFSDASWALQAELGIGTDYFDVSGMAMMTVESHIRYLDGAYRGDTIVFDSMVIDADAKRVHVGHRETDKHAGCQDREDDGKESQDRVHFKPLEPIEKVELWRVGLPRSQAEGAPH